MPSTTTLLVISVTMLLAGGGIIYMILQRRSSQHRGALTWIGMSFSILLLLVGAGMSMVALTAHVNVSSLSVDRSTLGKPAPELKFRLVDSNETGQLADYRGKVVVLNLWATWCRPCLEELEDLNRLQETYGRDEVVVVAISDEPRSSIQNFERNQVNIQMVSAYLPDEYTWPAPYDRVKQSRPTSFIIDREGIIRQTWPGARDFDYFSKAVEPYL
jgi:peroxiredoxin